MFSAVELITGQCAWRVVKKLKISVIVEFVPIRLTIPEDNMLLSTGDSNEP